MRRMFFVVGGAVFLAACSSWHGPAEVKLKNGIAISCPRGLTFGSKGIDCGQESRAIVIPWAEVAGYATK